jgi:uncharacterized protein (TIGR03437 family)
MRTALVFLSLIPAMAQFSGLAVTDDGSQLYFSSSLQLAGTTDENTYSKIFRYDGTGIHFVAQMARVATAGGGIVPTMLPTSNPYNLTSAYVSGNGSVPGYVGTADCPAGPCNYQGLQQTTLQFAGLFTPYVLPYGCQISKNARYALCITGGREPIYQQYSVFDLFGNQKPIYSPSCGQLNTAQITSLGEVFCGNALFSVSGSAMPLSFPAEVDFQMPISDDASTVAYVTVAVSNGVGSPGLYIENVSSGAQSVVYTDQQSRALNPLGLSNNGRVVLFELYSARTITQAAVVHADGTGFLQLTNDPTGVSTAILSGDGSTAFVVTNSGHLLKIDTTTGASMLIANGAEIQQIQGGAAAGSRNTIQGLGLADATVAAQTFPAGTSLGGTQDTLNGTPVPLLSVSATSVSFQIPWETALGNATIAVVRPSSPFMQSIPPLQIQRVQAVLAIEEIFSQDFSAINSALNPAPPGGFVNLYFTGLGPVATPETDGVPAQASPLPGVVTPLTVAVQTSSTTTMALNVAYAGLAPGFVGVYQVTVQVPSVVPHNPFFQVGSPNQFPLIVNSTAISGPAVWVTSNQ